jgi:hypothetical protein
MEAQVIEIPVPVGIQEKWWVLSYVYQMRSNLRNLVF